MAGGPSARAISTLGTRAEITRPGAVVKAELISRSKKRVLLVEVELTIQLTTHKRLMLYVLPKEMAVSDVKATIPINCPNTFGFSPTM